MATVQPHQASLGRLHRDLGEIFGTRLRSVVAYDARSTPESGGPGTASGREHSAHAMVLVETLTFADLTSCAAKAEDWARHGVATPLVTTREEFVRSLDAFPLELAEIAASHTVVYGEDPFENAEIRAADIRRACETQVRSHLLHLREGFLEARGKASHVAAVVAASIPPLRTLLVNLARLDNVAAHDPEVLAKHMSSAIGVPTALLDRLLGVKSASDLDESETMRVYAAYLDAVERLAGFIDRWKT
jgi:hypothetical protein